MILTSVGGAAYAALLWVAALSVAHARGLRLGSWPVGPIALCAAAAACIGSIFAPERATLLSASLIGTIVCATIDARTGLIFDVVSASMAIVVCGLAISCGRFGDGALAMLVVGGALLALYLGTSRRGIGLGDVKLASALALGYGLQLSVTAIGSAFILGAGYAGVLIGTGRAKRTDTLRFGPFIAGGAVLGLAANVMGYRW